MTFPSYRCDPSDPEAFARWSPWQGRLRGLLTVHAILAIILLLSAFFAATPSETWTWMRVGPLAALSLLYLVLAFQVNPRRPGTGIALQGLNRCVFIGLAALLVMVIYPGGYPLWMRGVQAVQVLLLLGAVYVIRRPEVDAVFPAWRQQPRRRRGVY
ncbi:hypothetical protein [Sciscionella sediminilitoris]|uniref:hypothetical protein n=1 Tax=Sciscionella sediminilitoris TaxID=1445613 RepID=UPI0004DFA2D9|nr:hypothetical protein [Sciscionella sp. SE31]